MAIEGAFAEYILFLDHSTERRFDDTGSNEELLTVATIKLVCNNKSATASLQGVQGPWLSRLQGPWLSRLSTSPREILQRLNQTSF